MASNYLSGLIDELDPAQRQKNTGFAGNIAEGAGHSFPAPAVEDNKQELPASVATADAAPSASGPKPWENARGFLVGFDTNKLNDPNKMPGESGKYTDAAKDFAKVTQTYGGGRGNLGQWVDALKDKYQGIKAVGDDKIDFGDGYGPVDVIRSDGQVVFQNTTGNPIYEQQYRAGTIGHQGGGGGAAAAAPSGAGGGGGFDALLSGNTGSSIDTALSKYADPDLLQRLIAQLQGA